MLDATQIVLDGVALTEFPVVSQIAGIASLTIDAGKGDLVGVGLGAAGLIPFIGNAADAAKIARRAGKIADAATTGGRLGNATTRSHISSIASTLENRGYNIIGGGGRVKEEFLRPLGGGRRGGSFVDITASHPKYGTLRINTVDTLKNGITPTARELRNAARIRKQRPGGTSPTNS